MNWGWVKPLLLALLEFLDKKLQQPGTLEDAKTPETTRERWFAYLRQRLRSKGGDLGQPK